MTFYIGDVPVGPSHPAYIIAEIGSNYDRDLNRAFELIHMARDCGANAAKFQHYTAETLVNQCGFDLLSLSSHQSNWNSSVFDVYDKVHLQFEWTHRLHEECLASGIEFMTSPYSHDLLDKILPFISSVKIGSGDITNIPLIVDIASHSLPVLLATGASSIEDVDRAVTSIPPNVPLCIMQCNTNYESNPDHICYQNISTLTQYKSLFPSAYLGISCHMKTSIPVLAAVSLGACVIEKHFTDDCSREGPDHSFALNCDEFSSLVKQVRQLEACLGDGIKKVEHNEQETYHLQRRSICTNKNLAKGHVISSSDIEFLRPFVDGSFHPYQSNDVIGSTLIDDIPSGTILNSSHFF